MSECPEPAPLRYKCKYCKIPITKSEDTLYAGFCWPCYRRIMKEIDK